MAFGCRIPVITVEFGISSLESDGSANGKESRKRDRYPQKHNYIVLGQCAAGKCIKVAEGIETDALTREEWYRYCGINDYR